MFNSRFFTRKVVTLGICASIAFSSISYGVGQAPKVEAAVASSADKVISTGNKFLGVKYRFGAPSGINYAFDCSSFTQYIFKQTGVTLPRTSSQQATKGDKVAKSDLKKGDLVFFKDPGRAGSIGHVAIYAGSNQLLHTYGKGGVKYSNLSSNYWNKNYVTARRILNS